MKKYLVKYSDFANCYSLRWTDNKNDFDAAIADGWEHITRKKAIRLCAEENRRRKEDYNFSGYADFRIFPYDASREEIEHFDMTLKGFYTENGYIYERKTA